MSFQTSASPETTSQQATAPTVRLLQFDQLAPDQFSDTVNLFNGAVFLPLKLATLTTAGGLQADLSISYRSDSFDPTGRWNLEEPTGPIGLGWSFSYEMIVRDPQGSVANIDDAFFLAASDGSRSRLHPIARTDGVTAFQAENFQYERITFDAASNSWTIIDAQATIKTFGGDASARQEGVCWGAKGNWIGDSCVGGQTTTTLAWNLSGVSRGWDDRIAFSYENDVVALRTGGPALFTRASYLAAISDGSGRGIRLRYGEKRFDATAHEYEPPNSCPGTAVGGFQDRYQTRFLAAVSITQAAGGIEHTLSSIQLLYRFLDGSPPDGNPRDFVKRALASLVPVDADGRCGPALDFSYFDGTEPDSGGLRGGLARVAYPSGASGAYLYATQPLQGTERRTQLTEQAAGTGLLRAWFGSAYAVILRYDADDGRRLVVTVQDWNGSWIGSPRLIDALLPGELDLSSLQVDTFDDWFLLVFRTLGAPGGPATRAIAMRRRWGSFGGWYTTDLDLLPLVGPDGQVSVVAGPQFVAATTTDRQTLCRYGWDPINKSWISAPLRLAQGREFVLAAAGSYVTLCAYDPEANVAVVTAHHLDLATLAWVDAPLGALAPILWQAELPKLQFALADTFAAATFLLSEDPGANTLTYRVEAWTWDRDLMPTGNVALVPGRVVPADSVEPFFLSIAAHSQLGNVGSLWRWNATAWVAGSVGGFDQGDRLAHVIYDDDLVVASNGVRNAAASFQPAQEAYNALPVTQTVAGPAIPTLSALYATVGNAIYLRTPERDLVPLGGIDPAVTIASNQGGGFLLLGRPAAASMIQLLRDGILSPAAVDLGGQAFAQPGDKGSGTVLAGGADFITYQGASLAVPQTIHLHHFVRGRTTGPLTAIVVTAVWVDDGLDAPRPIAFRYPGGAVAGPYDLGAQFTEADIALGTADFAATPQGFRRSRFYNSLSPEDQFPSAMLNGLLRERSEFDSADRPVGSAAYQYTVATSYLDLAGGGVVRPLAGGHVRLIEAQSTICDPDQPSAPTLIATAVMTFDEGTGQPALRSTDNYRLDGTAETVCERWTYAPTISPGMLAANLLSAVALKTTEVDGTVIAIDATTYDSGGSPPAQPWSVCRTFRACVADATLTESEWSNASLPDPTRWRLTREVRLRGKTGREAETWDAGIVRATQFDRSERLCVASFVNASVAGGECGYFGAEPYEAPGMWTLGGSAAALLDAVAAGDCHTGTRAIVLPAGPAALAATYSLEASADRVWLFTCWTKASAAGCTAAWEIVTPAGTQRVALPSAAHQWQPTHAYVRLAASPEPQTVTLSLVNGSGAVVLVDELCLAVAVGGARVQVSDPLWLDPVATFAVGGAVERRLRDTSRAVVATTHTAAEANRLLANGLARNAPLMPFATAPNVRIVARPRNWSLFQSFSLGQDWADGWALATPSAWFCADGALHHTGAAEHTASYAPPAGQTGATLQFRATMRAAAGAAFGFAIGAVRAIWSFDAAAWLVTGPDGMSVAAAQPALCVLPAAAVAELEAGRLSDASVDLLQAAGLAFAEASCVVATITADRTWQLTDDGSGAACLVTLPAAGGLPSVVHHPRVITALAADSTLVLFADGVRVLSCATAEPITGALGLLAAGDVAFDLVVLAGDAMAEVDHFDGLMTVRQRQVASEAGPVANATILDAIARPAVTSQGALLAPAAGQLYAYEDGLAALDWATFMMTGIVADQHPDSGGYCYARTRYEDRPSGREIERGLPGAAYAIVAEGVSHTARRAYGLSDGACGIAAARFARRVDTDANGVATTTLVDLRGRTVAVTAPSSAPPDAATLFHFDAASHLVQVAFPAGTNDTFNYDFLGQVTTTRRAGEGTIRYLYDSLGRLRFHQTAQGSAAPTPYIAFTCYDELSRIVRQGAWDQAWGPGLNPDDPAQPDAPASLVNVYDGIERADLATLGRLASRTSAHQLAADGTDDGFTAAEDFTYDPRGNILARTLLVPAFSAATYVLASSYDLQDLPVATQCPQLDGSAGTVIAWRRDRLGRAAAITLDGAAFCDFTYDADGRLVGQHVSYSNGGGEDRLFAYEPPGWPRAIVSPAFEEAIVYAGDGPASSWNGAASQIITTAQGSRPAIVQQAVYDAAGHLSGVSTTVGADTTTTAYTFDRNGNAVQFAGADLVREGDALASATKDGATSIYTYDADGAVVGRTPADGWLGLALEYDRWSGLPLSQRATGTPDGRIDHHYAQAQEVMTVTATGGSERRSLTLRDAAGNPVVRLGEGAADTVVHVWSARGLEALVAGEAGTRLVVACDRQGSVRRIVDGSGVVIAAFDYDAWGGRLGTDLPTSVTDLRYLARRLFDTGLYDFRRRLYDPATGGFLSPDPARTGTSPYVYGASDPLLYRDADGLFAFLFFAIVMLVALVAGAVAGGIVIAQRHLRGGKAAAAFFGIEGLSLGAGAATFAGGGLISAGLAELAGTSAVAGLGTVGSGLTLTSVGVVAGAGVGAAIGSAQAAGQAALLGDDVADAARGGAIAGAASGAVLGLSNAVARAGEEAATEASYTGRAFVARSALEENQRAGRFIGTTLLGAAAAGSGSAAQGNDRGQVLLDTLQGLALAGLGTDEIAGGRSERVAPSQP